MKAKHHFLNLAVNGLLEALGAQMPVEYNAATEKHFYTVKEESPALTIGTTQYIPTEVKKVVTQKQYKEDKVLAFKEGFEAGRQEALMEAFQKGKDCHREPQKGKQPIQLYQAPKGDWTHEDWGPKGGPMGKGDWGGLGPKYGKAHWGKGDQEPPGKDKGKGKKAGKGKGKKGKDQGPDEGKDQGQGIQLIPAGQGPTGEPNPGIETAEAEGDPMIGMNGPHGAVNSKTYKENREEWLKYLQNLIFALHGSPENVVPNEERSHGVEIAVDNWGWDSTKCYNTKCREGSQKWQKRDHVWGPEHLLGPHHATNYQLPFPHEP